MEKPILFFSHSSKDKDFLFTLKNKILSKTANTIEVFQSSDGESIPFGNNWVHKIEENLEKSKIMFVFISPNSLKSNWIYFESGFSYSKGVKVIPIGINGIDIGNLAPPINLLQGFNITSHEGLNNIITIINKEFSNSFPENFTNDDYEDLMKKSNNIIQSNHYFDEIDFIEIRFYHNLTNNKFKDNVINNILDYFKNNSIKHSIDQRERIYLHGMMIYKYNDDYWFKIDQLKMVENVNIVNQLFRVVYENETDLYWLRIKFLRNIDMLTINFKLSSRLNNIGIEMSEINGKMYKYKNLRFALDDLDEEENLIGEGKRLRIVYPAKTFNEIEIFELVKILFENKIIWKID